MDQNLWELVCENAKHIKVINHEMGAVQANVEWLTWWVQVVAMGTALTILVVIVNIIMTKKYSKRR